MVDDTLPGSAPGRYVPFGRASYYLPDELPPVSEFDLDDEFQETLQSAIYELGRLEGISEETDASPLAYTTLIRREAVESVVIEGGEIDIEETFRPSEIDRSRTTKKDVREALNYEEAIRTGATRVRETGEITLELLRELHEVLLEGVRGDCDRLGEFRQKPIHIPPPEPHRDPFRPPAPDRVPSLMSNLERYLTQGGQYHALAEAGIVHYQFETIHPFEDGNGRLGRILITLQLIQRGYLDRPLLYPSAYFNERKVEYVNRMRAVSEEGAWEPWLRFFVNGIGQQAADAVTRAEELRSLHREYEQEYGHEKTAADRLAMRLFQRPYVTTNDVAELLDISDQTARNAIGELEESGLLEETTGKERYREYKAVDIFDILNRQIR